MKNTTIKLENGSFLIQEHDLINKIIGTIDPKNFAKLIYKVGLTANPRKSKVGKITNAIQETLQFNPEMFSFKTNGLLVATSECQRLDRGRFNLSFEDQRFEGVLDGGHNTLAIGLHILDAFGVDIRKIKIWDDFLEVWNQQDEDAVYSLVDELKFAVPIEIIYPTEKAAPNFIETVFDISDARNNNDSLSSTTKHDHQGYYEILKESLDESINEKVEWKDNDVNENTSIKSQDIIAMSLVPLLALQRENKLPEGVPTINPVNIYSSKSKCVDIFNKLISIERDKSGNNEVIDTYIVSAFRMLKDLPRMYDLIYKEFPDSYNINSSRFGGIESVRIYKKNEKAGKRFLRNPPLTKFYGEECVYKYPDGFIIPVFCALSEWMEVRGDKLEWKVTDPEKLLKDNLTKFTKMFLETTIKDNDYNPQSIGKNTGGYMTMSREFQFALLQ
jgi:hypothetical protein